MDYHYLAQLKGQLTSAQPLESRVLSIEQEWHNHRAVGTAHSTLVLWMWPVSQDNNG